MSRSGTHPHGIGSLIVKINQEFQNKFGTAIFNEETGAQDTYARWEPSGSVTYSGYQKHKIDAPLDLVYGKAIEAFEGGELQYSNPIICRLYAELEFSWDDATYTEADLEFRLENDLDGSAYDTGGRIDSTSPTSASVWFDLYYDSGASSFGDGPIDRILDPDYDQPALYLVNRGADPDNPADLTLEPANSYISFVVANRF